MPRRTHDKIRKLILHSFGYNAQAIRQISEKSGVDWYTTERQLVYLKGRDLVEEVFKHKQLRLFQITGLGRRVLNDLGNSRRKKTMSLIKLIKTVERSYGE